MTLIVGCEPGCDPIVGARETIVCFIEVMNGMTTPIELPRATAPYGTAVARAVMRWSMLHAFDRASPSVHGSDRACQIASLPHAHSRRC